MEDTFGNSTSITRQLCRVHDGGNYLSRVNIKRVDSCSMHISRRSGGCADLSMFWRTRLSQKHGECHARLSIHTDTYNNEKPRASNGENSTIANPVKGAIFSMLQTLILEGVTPPSKTHGLAQEDYAQKECDQVLVTAKACKTLACILEAGDKLGSSRKGDNEIFLWVPNICRCLHSLLLSTPASIFLPCTNWHWSLWKYWQPPLALQNK